MTNQEQLAALQAQSLTLLQQIKDLEALVAETPETLDWPYRGTVMRVINHAETIEYRRTFSAYTMTLQRRCYQPPGHKLAWLATIKESVVDGAPIVETGNGATVEEAMATAEISLRATLKSAAERVERLKSLQAVMSAV